MTAEAAAWTGLPEGIAVAVGNVDAHVTAPAAQAVEPGQMVAIMGTSTCHVMSSDVLAEVPGMCGVVDGGIVPGLWGYEAGQTGVGDIFGWFVETNVPPSYADEAAERGLGVHEHLTELAAAQPVGAHGLVALDWHSGNRSVLVDHELSGVIVGQTLATRPEDIYRALIEATAFGTRTIIEAFEKSGVPVTELVVAGGLPKNRVPDADLRRRHPAAAERDRLRAGPGAGLGDPRGGRGRRLPGHPRRGRGDGPRDSAPYTCRTRTAPAATTRCTPNTELARLLRQGRQRRAAPAAADANGGDAVVSRQLAETSASLRRDRAPGCTPS